MCSIALSCSVFEIFSNMYALNGNFVRTDCFIKFVNIKEWKVHRPYGVCPFENFGRNTNIVVLFCCISVGKVGS